MRPIQFSFERIQQTPDEVDFDLSPAEFDLLDDPEYRFMDPVQGHLNAKKISNDSALVSGNVSTVATAECVRCLLGLRIPLNINVHLIFTKTPLDPREMEGDEETNFFSGDFIDPMERLREELMLALPHLPACELEDENLCPIRGERIPPLVFGPQEQEEAPNSGWKAQLSDLKKQLKPEEPKES